MKFFQREVKKLDKENKVYTVDAHPILAPACIVSDGYHKIAKVTEENYIQELLLLCQKWNIKLIVPTIDTELLVLSQNKEIFIEKGITPIVSSIDFVTKCRDKRLTNLFFEANDINIPKAIDKYNPSFPLFIKPYNGSLSKDIYLIKEQSELKDYHLSNPDFMFMEYINPDAYSEFTVDTYYNKDNELKCIVPRERIYVRAGEINKGVTRKNEIIDIIKQRLSKIEGAIGCITMQFFFNKKTKEVIGIEINPRFGGGYPLSYLAGANYPEYILKEYILNEQISSFEQWEENLLMLRYDDEILVRSYEN